MRLKSSLRVLALTLAVLLSFSSAALAAVPNNTIIIGNKAYNLGLLNDPVLGPQILIEFMNAGNTYTYRNNSGALVSQSSQTVLPGNLPQVTYTSASGQTTVYAEHDGDPVVTTATISGVVATNGTIEVTLSAAPTTAPVATDFTFTKTIGTGTASELVAGGFTWTAETKKATFTFTAIAGAATEQSVVVAATYKSGTAVSATAFPVAAATRVATTVRITNAAGASVTVGGATLTLVAEVKDQFETVIATPVVWGTVDAAASVDPSTGVVTAVAAGTANITATVAGIATPATYAVTVNAAAAPAAPAVTANDDTNVIVGINATMEYQIGTGAWTTYDSAAAPDLSGDKSVKVRVKAAGVYPAGLETTLTFTTNVFKVTSATAVNNTTVSVVFSDELDKTSAEAATNYSANNGMTFTAAALQTDKKTVKLTTNAQVAAVVYTVTVAGVRNSAATTIATPNNTASFNGSEIPALVAYRDNAGTAITTLGFSTLANSTTIKADYNVNIDATTVNTQTVKLYNVTAANYVPGTVAIAGGDIVFTPSIALETGKSYRLEISGTVKSINSFALGADAAFTYIVGAAPLASGTKTPADTAANIAVNTKVSIVFDQDMDATTLTTSSVIVEKLDALNNVAGAVTGTVAYEASLRKVTFTPATNLEGATKYQATVKKTLVKNVAGIPVQADTVWTFTTAASTKPTVTKVEIYNATNAALETVTAGATGISLAGNAASATVDVQITFSKQVLGTSVTAETILLLDKTTGVYSTIAVPVQANGTTMTFGYGAAAGATLTAGHQYEIKLSGIKDTTGNENVIDPYAFLFTVETSAPTIVRVFSDVDGSGAFNAGDILVTEGKTNLDRTKNVIVEFSENIDNAVAVLGTTTKLYNSTDGAYVNLATIASATKYITFAAGDFAATDKAYKMTISTALTDAAGNPMAAAFERNFVMYAAQPAVDNTASSVTHSNGTVAFHSAGRRTDVDVDGPIVIDFTEAVAAASATSTNFVLTKTSDGSVVACTVTRGGTGNTDKVTVTPSANLADNTSYTITVKKDVTDLVGNKMVADYTYEFVTENNTVPTVSAASVANNATGVALNTDIVLTFNVAMVTGAGAGNVATGDTDEIDGGNTSNVRIQEIDATGAVTATNVDISTATTYNASTKQTTIALGSVAGLKYNQKYCVVVDTEAASIIGTPAFNSGVAYKLYFTTVADTTAPTVKSLKQGATTITEGKTNIAATTLLTLTFNDTDIDVAGVNQAAISIFDTDLQSFDDGWNATLVTPTNASPNDTLAINLGAGGVSGLTNDHHYRLTISGVKDTEGNTMATYTINFTTGVAATLAVDADGPADDSATGYADVADGANTVLVTAKVRVVPTKELDTTTVTSTTAYINDATGTKVAATIVFDGANHNFTITPSASLTKGATYHVYLTNGIKDIAGNAATAVDFTFSTVLDAALINFTAFTDYTGGAIAASGVVQAANTQTLKIDFDKNILASSANATNVKIHNDTDNVYVTLLDGNITVAAARVTITPLATLTAGKVYTISATGLLGTSVPAETLAGTTWTRTFAVQQTSVVITDNETDNIMKNGATAQFTVMYGPTDVTNAATYTPGNGLATVSAAGLMTAAAGNGTVNVSVSYNGSSSTSATFTVDNTAPTFTAATVQTPATNVMLAGTMEFTVTFNAAAVHTYNGAYGNTLGVEIIAGDLGAGTQPTAAFGAGKLTITINNNAGAPAMTVLNLLNAVNAVPGFAAAVSGTGATGTAVTAANLEAVATTASSGGQDVITMTVTEANGMTNATLATGNVNTDFNFRDSTTAAATVTGTSAWASSNIVLTVTSSDKQLKGGDMYMKSNTAGNAGAVEDAAGNPFAAAVGSPVTIN